MYPCGDSNNKNEEKEDDDDIPLSQVLMRHPSRSLLDDTSDEDDEDLVPIAALQGDRKYGRSAAEKYKERVRGKLDHDASLQANHRRRSYEPARVTHPAVRSSLAMRSMSLHHPKSSGSFRDHRSHHSSSMNSSSAADEDEEDDDDENDTDDDLPLGVVVPLPSATGPAPPLFSSLKYPLYPHQHPHHREQPQLGFAESLQHAFEAVMHRH
ncbi:hypothetical protein EC973_003988 [Apophysomyces ossiformis]|uniref:Uncharacterized protein n=1 Tax=Apophysomyces ossiformis TaxID=679940 RepID=A0A8H7BQL8_9FUNG|nr:hypothetical protein EC973_003988 [Apophysomyces ossiformis]